MLKYNEKQKSAFIIKKATKEQKGTTNEQGAQVGFSAAAANRDQFNQIMWCCPFAEVPKAPGQGDIVGTHDPKYQTSAGVDGEVFGEDKKRTAGADTDGGGGGPQTPQKGGFLKNFLGTYDPNYQTLVSVGGEIFGQDKKKDIGGGDGGLQAPINKDGKTGTFDPNYQLCKFYYNIFQCMSKFHTKYI
ncbi:unnamed protein product [Brugia timori]|uniref:Uncharacterized protein n=1 Tax=Brugia timori TaxID=42155 RepID=A0A0R3QVA1_9BILA|nr:unnamed protein product [Brugia timori]